MGTPHVAARELCDKIVDISCKILFLTYHTIFLCVLIFFIR